MKVGIDQIGYFTPNKYVDMVDLAHARNQDPNKFLIGIGQKRMSVADPTQDAVSMGINATLRYINKIDKSKVGLLIFGTESSVDQSKSGSLFVKSALKLDPTVRAFEVKEACFGLTAGVMIAQDFVRLHPDQTAIVIGSDIARYGINTAGEVTQGAGSVSLLISSNPRILEINEGHSAYSEDINDFWRPNYSKTAKVDGKYSTQVYLNFFKHTFSDYKKQMDRFTASKELNANVGNIYTGSLYLSLLSLLENGGLKAGDLIGLFSYGSGAMAEFYSANVVEGYENELDKDADEALLDKRKKLSVPEYEKIFSASLVDPQNNVELTSDEEKGRYYFAGICDDIRQYKVK